MLLARKLGLSGPISLDAGEMFEQYFSEHPEKSLCVLLFDELDQYARASTGDSLGRSLFNHLESVRKDRKDVGILAAGGLGVFILRDLFGSSFISRAHPESPEPFSEAEINELGRPFAARGDELSSGVVKAIFLGSGGNPALVTYGLQHLWDREAPTEEDVAKIYAEFSENQREFIRDVRDAIAHPAFSSAPARVLARIRRSAGSVARADLLEECRTERGELTMDLSDVLKLLRAAGLIAYEQPLSADPLHVRDVASVLNFPEPSHRFGDFQEQLIADIRRALDCVYRWAPDYFHRGARAGDKKLVPEANFSAHLGGILEALGWRVEREAIHGAGRTDLKLERRPGEHGVVELKIWARNDYRDIHRQLEGYWVSGVLAAVAIMITDEDIAGWAQAYLRECLSGPALVVTERSPSAPFHGHFTVESTAPDGFAVRAEHLLLRVPRS